MKNETTYNGWTNYETWRIALEWFDNSEYLDEMARNCKDVYQLAEVFKLYILECFDNEEQTIYRQYADAFICDVNFYEIAEHYTDLKNED